MEIAHQQKKKHIITLGGFPGSGKSTVKRLLAEKLGYATFSTGDFVRSMAHERNLTLEEFNELIVHDKTLDTLIDEHLTQIERAGDHYIIDSHLAFHFVPSGFSVLLLTPLEKAAERIFNDARSPSRITSGEVVESIEAAYEKTKKRVENHIMRYDQHYGVRPYEEKNYDFIITTEEKSPEEVTNIIFNAFNTWLQK